MTRAPLSPVVGPTVASSAYVLEIALFPLALPQAEVALGLGRVELALLANAYGIAVAAAVLAGGWLGDRIGARRMFFAGVALFAAGALGVALSEGMAALLAGRLLQGLGGGLMSPSIPVLLTRGSGGRPGRVLALWNALSGFIVALAPLAGVPLVARFGWPAVFLVMAAVALAALALTAANPPPAQPRRATGAPPTGRGLPGPATLYLYVALSYGAILLFLFAVPLLLADRALPPGMTAGVLGLFWASFTGVGLLLRNRIDGPLVGPLLAAGPILVLAGFAALTAAGTAPAAVWLAALLIGTGFAFGNAPSTVLILRHAPEGRLALAASLDITCARLGAVAVIAALGSLAAGPMLAGVALTCLAATACALPHLRDAPRPA